MNVRIAAMTLLACAVSLGAAQAGDGDWTVYSNARFGTVADVPADGFTADPAPANGDGRSWTSGDGLGHISVYGSHMAVARDFAGYRAFALDAAREGGVDITYSAAKTGWFAWSGFKGDEIVYMKAELDEGCAAPIVHHIYLRYPKNQREAYAPIVKRMAHSLHFGPGADCE